jgi:hypothetical protein
MQTGPIAWLRITAPAAVAGTVASVLTYALLYHSTSAVASGTGLLVDSVGAVASAGTRYWFGDIPATTVRIMGRLWSETSASSVRTGGTYAAIATAAAVGGTTALTVSLGTHLVEATIEYGGALTQAAAQKIGEAYLRIKAADGQGRGVYHGDEEGAVLYSFTESDNEWICMDCSGSAI